VLLDELRPVFLEESGARIGGQSKGKLSFLREELNICPFSDVYGIVAPLPGYLAPTIC
jgi:hypothetical protein